jgi:hypothetical protein
MNTPPDPVFQGQGPGSDSRDCINIIVDGPGDTTVRPMRPELVKLIMAERERMARFLEELEQEARKANPSDDSDSKNGSPGV